MITKTILKKEDYYIQFTEKEMEQLNIKAGDKFTWKLLDDGVMLEKHVPIEIDFSDFDKDTLVYLVEQSCERDMSVEDIIVEVLKEKLAKELPDKYESE